MRAHDRIDSFVHSNASPEGILNTVFACTCPLYRQLNLEHELCWNGEWKKNIVMFETGILNGVKSENLKDVQTEISALQQEDEINTTQKLFEAIYLIHEKHKTSDWEATSFQTITANVKKLAVEFSSQVADGGAKSMPMEYDGWTIHNMLRKMKGLPLLSNTKRDDVVSHQEFIHYALWRVKDSRTQQEMPTSA